MAVRGISFARQRRHRHRVAERNIMRASAGVEVGQRYRTVRPDGGAAPTVWNVVKVYVPWHGGWEHACLKSVDGSAGAMTLATSVIAGRKRFLREVDAPNVGSGES
jgi:hypothetical protein